jgi:mannosyltransferase
MTGMLAPADATGTGGSAIRSRAASGVRRIDLGLAAAVVVGLALRFWGLGAQSLWYDEWLTTEATSGSLAHLVDHVANREGITPPYFVLMWGWVRLLGDGELALRSLSALVGVATIPVAYAVAREVGQRRAVARVAALLVAVNPMLVWYSQEARPYSLLAFLGGLSVLMFVRAERSGRRGDLMLWGLVSAVALAVHYFAGFLVAAEAVGLVLSRRYRWRELLLSCLPGALVVGALAPIALEQHSHAPNRAWISGFALSYRLEEAARSALVGPSPPVDRLWLVPLAVVVASVLLLLTRASRRDRVTALRLAAIGGAGVALPLAAGLVGPDVFLSRYVVASVVPLVVAVSVGVGAARPAWVGLGGVAVATLVSVGVVAAVAADPGLQRTDWRAVADVAASGSETSVLIVTVGGDQTSPLRHYVPGLDTLDGNETIPIDQVDVLVGKPAEEPCNFLVGRACAFVFLGAPLPEGRASAFVLTDRYELDQFAVERYRASEPVRVGRSDLLAPVDGAGAWVWIRGS